jgi:hypothetical protein
MRYAVFAILLSAIGCVSAPKRSTSTRRAVIFEPRASGFSRVHEPDLEALYQLGGELLATSPRFSAVKLKTVRATLAKQRKRAYRRCRSWRCQKKLGRKLFSASHLLALGFIKRGRRCRVQIELVRLDQKRRRAKRKLTARSGCNGGALAGALTTKLCELAVAKDDRPSRRCLVRGELFWLDRMSDQLFAAGSQRKRRRRQKPGDKPAAIELGKNRFAERIVALKGAYLRVVQHALPVEAVIAHCRAARLYDRLAKRLSSQPSGNRELASGFAKQAAQIYRACIQRAERTSVDHPVLEEAKKRAPNP